VGRKEPKPIESIRARDGDFEGPEIAEPLQRSRCRPTIKKEERT
ncbi:unnamed protein product, partial [Brassica oleracea var. botrytis]